MKHVHPSLRIVFLGFLGLALGGCVSRSETFTGQQPEQVWTALVAVARTPNYGDPDPTERWTVRENDVWVDDAGRRIEIFRRLERDLHNPASRPRHEEREWKIQVTMQDTHPPKAKLTARQLNVPAHTWKEAERYFDQVWDVLGGKPEEVKEAELAATRPDTQPAAPPPAYER
jgi:hypothetical protein